MIFNLKKQRGKAKAIVSLGIILIFLSSCQKNAFDPETVTASSLREVPALRLNFRFENDVPAPPPTNSNAQTEEKNGAVQTAFDQTRPEETLERTISSPDKKRVLAVYQKLGDLAATYRLDLYSAEGKLLNKITPNGLAVYYPDTIVWSPDNNNVAFVGMIRLGQTVATPTPDAPIPPNLDNSNANIDAHATDSNANANANSNIAQVTEPTKQVLTFRTEQIYICNAEGGDLKPITQNEGLIYFYFVWSPDSSALAALAATWKEWQYSQYQAAQKGEVFVPLGRPRLVEKNGRIRLLDDNLTLVRPVWSPDSAKVGFAFDKEIRIYDAIGNSPTQAAIPLLNQLKIAAKTFDDELKRKEAGNTNANSNAKAANVNSPANLSNSATPNDVNALPDESSLISFNPIVQLEWTEDKMLYLQTGFIKEFTGANSTYNTRSNLRWHRLLLSPQAVKIN